MATAQALTVSLAALGYPGFQYLRPATGADPVDVLLTALAQDDLEPRITAALPWVLIHSDDIDWERLLSRAERDRLQNRLGFLVSIASAKAASSAKFGDRAALLGGVEARLSRIRLEREDTLCRNSWSAAERRWLAKNVSDQARYWRVLTDLSPHQIRYCE